MAGDVTTIARPYAEAAFQRALETDSLDCWSDMLALLGTAAADPALARFLANPRLTAEQKVSLVNDIGADGLTDEGKNLVRLLGTYGRLGVLGEIARAFEQRRAEHQGTVDVLVRSAYVLQPAQEKQLATALQAKLGRNVRITSEKDPALIGGFRVQAGDLVIDASVAGQLGRLAHELGI